MTRMRRCLSLCAAALSLCLAAQGRGSVDFPHPDFLSFESGKRTSTLHSKFGERSLEWKWRRSGAELSIRHAVDYHPVNPDPGETSVSTFVFWVYSPKVYEGTLTVEFLKEGRVCCQFPYLLGFTGWRGAWVAFDRDMQGSPEEGMDEIRFRVDGPRRGVLYLDGIIPAAYEDSRYHTADFQAPWINRGTDVHWIRLEEFWQRQQDIAPPSGDLRIYAAQMDTVNRRFVDIVSSGRRGCSLDEARSIYESMDIVRNPDGTLNGKAIFFTRYGETFINLGVTDASRQFGDNGQLVRRYNDDMLRIALAWMRSADPAERDELARIYVGLTRHLLDQGFASGSAMGTLHHLGYSMRNFYTAPVIMRDVLREAGLLGEVQQAMEWFSGLGEVKTAPQSPGMDIDAFNTYLMGRVAAVLLMDEGAEKYACMLALSRWVDNGYKYTGGTKACFKPDGMVFHHRRAYPAYAVGGFDGAVKAVWLLHGTPFAVSEESHGILKKALLEMRFYCNLLSFPLAMSGRHPDGKGALEPEQYAMLALAGSPDGREPVDEELAAAYLRLTSSAGRQAKAFLDMGILPEESPEGVRSYGYNCSLSARQRDWLVTIAGHSRYLWSAEIYKGANLYGRYLTHGSMEILADCAPPGGDGRHVSALGSGYQVAGYDWRHIPGTTAAVIPMERMRARVLNVDNHSGYEEMLLSDEWFAGGVAHSGGCGAFAMKLHENDKYNGSLKALKSFFVFGDCIICMGSGIESALQPVHTTLYQNVLPGTADSASGPDEPAAIDAGRMLRDRFGNVWLIAQGEAWRSEGVQHSFHEETGAPTCGRFEKAWIVNDSPQYEYMVMVHPSEDEIESCERRLPYEVIRRDSSLHAVRDIRTGVTGAAAFEDTGVDSLVLRTSPAILMWSREGDVLHLSVSNPDLALYSGPADEVTGPDGKRVERSVYSREWIDNDCAPVQVTLEVAGRWSLAAPANAECTVEGDRTRIVVRTAEARTEDLTLCR